MTQLTEVKADSARDALAFTVAMARADTAACDAILASANLPMLAASLAAMVVTTLIGTGVEDPATFVQELQSAYVARSVRNVPGRGLGRAACWLGST
jgi:hypothetical protein